MFYTNAFHPFIMIYNTFSKFNNLYVLVLLNTQFEVTG